MTCEHDPDDYLADEAVQAAAAAFEDAVKAAGEKRGYHFKGVAVAANFKECTGVLTSGCGCPSCVLNILQSVGEAYGAHTEVTEVKHSREAAVH